MLRLLLAPGSRLIAADLVLQRAAAHRFLDRPPAKVPGRRRWVLGMGMSLPRSAFRPPPQVDSAVLVIRRR